MAQLYIQKAVVPDSWDMSGAPASTVICLSVDATINYSDGSADTLPANTPAVLPGGGTSVDRTHDVYVPFTIKGSGVLSIIKESLLPTLTVDYAPLARVELHGIKPYQPEPYLAAGGLGSGGATTTTTILSTAGLERTMDGAEPSTWWLPSFDDSAWPTSVASGNPPDSAVSWGPVTLSGYAGAASVTKSDVSYANSAPLYLRRHFALPAGVIASAALVVVGDSVIAAAWINGTALTVAGNYDSQQTITVPPGLLLPGASNLLALRDLNGTGGGSNNPVRLAYALVVRSQGPGGVVDPGGHEGDLLYYHGGAWVDLPIGTSGQELTVVAGDPAWTDQPADTDTSGTVTSVALAGPTGTTTSGSPITSSGTITLSWASQSANTFLGAPNGSSGTPTFRALVGADIPVDASTIVVSAGTIKGNYQAGSGVSISGNTISATGSGGSVTSVALSLPGIFSVAGSPVTTAGTLSASLATQAPHTFWGGPASGSAAAPTFRALQGSDLPAAAGAGGHIHAHGHFH